MVNFVSNEFGVGPEKVLDELLKQNSSDLDGEYVRSLTKDQFDNMWLAQWRLCDQTNTVPILRGAVGKYAYYQGQYSLTILSDLVAQENNRAAAQRREMDLRQKLSNNPKF
jgi:hypothetical protein